MEYLFELDMILISEVFSASIITASKHNNLRIRLI